MKTILFIMLFTLTSVDQPKEIKPKIIIEDPMLKVDILHLQINRARNEESKIKQEIAFSRDTIKRLVTE